MLRWRQSAAALDAQLRERHARWRAAPGAAAAARMVTPALVGGPTDQMVSGVIADAMNRDLNWGKASALGAILLGATIILYLVYDRLVGIDNVKLG